MEKLDEEYIEEMKVFGLSVELTERIDADAVAGMYKKDGYNWALWTYPPTERDDLKYFIAYPDCATGEYPMFTNKRCARISILAPEYIKCSDCTKEEWILTHEEKKRLCEYLNEGNNWKRLQALYEDALEGFSGKIVHVKGLPIPDYMQLPEE